jgi:hypothetical protein
MLPTEATDPARRPVQKIVLMWATWAVALVAYLFIFYDFDLANPRRGVAQLQSITGLKVVSPSGDTDHRVRVRGAAASNENRNFGRRLRP